MSSLGAALADYLAVRRALGYQLRKNELLLTQFIAYLKAHGEKQVTVKAALAWATSPKNATPYWWASRLSVVRCFAAHLRTLDARTEVPPKDILPRRRSRATPYLYSPEQLVALMEVAASLRPAHLGDTYRTLIGLLAVTGMRVGEAINLDRADFESEEGLLTIRKAKFNKSRQVPLHPSAAEALRGYLRRRNRLRAGPTSSAFFISTAGTRLHYANVQRRFHRLVREAGCETRSPLCRPRLHDLRHSFAVQALVDAYRQNVPVGPRLAILSTYLGHVEPSGTYWYLSASPELMGAALPGLEHHLGGRS